MSIHIVSHTHWDREWYRTFNYFNVKLSYLFDNLFKILDENQDYKHFMLDGQMVMIEDYLLMYPSQKEKLKKYVEEDRIIIGPWYTQPDEFAPNAESLIRNLLIGINMAREYGEYMKVGYLPDSFGHSSQLPSILRGFNINKACIMRGVPIDKLSSPLFNWKSLNNDAVLTVSLPTGYSNGMFLPSESSKIDLRIKKEVEKLKKYGQQDNFLIMEGIDHQFPNGEITSYIKKHKDIKHSSLENYINALERTNLEVLNGELISPVTNRVHLTMASTRMKQKQQNRDSERLLIHKTEPISVLNYLNGTTYKKALINNAWKKLLKNQTHDSICGCCTDEVHREMDQRFAEIKEIGETIYKANSRAFAKKVSGDQLTLTVYNHSFVKGKRVVKTVVYTDSDNFILRDPKGNIVSYILESQVQTDASQLSIWSLYMDTPCLVYETKISFLIDFDFNYGFLQLDIIEDKENTPKTYLNSKKTNISTEYYEIKINQNGSLNVYDKEFNKEYKELVIFEDSGDCGDTYNFCPIEDDPKITSELSRFKNLEVEQSEILTTVKLSLDLEVPSHLNTEKRSDDKKVLELDIEYTLYNHSRRIDVKTTFNNTILDHRLRVLLDSGIETRANYSEVNNGIIRRDNYRIENENWNDLGYVEKPLSIYPMQRFVYLKDNNDTFSVLNKDLTEYEILDNHTIALTLLRSVGYMGKGNLSVRPGRPSGVPIETPDAEELGVHSREFTIYTGKNLNVSMITNQAQIYSVNTEAVQSMVPLTNIKNRLGEYLDMYQVKTLQSVIEDDLSVDSNNNLFELKTDDLVITSIKKAENEDAVLVRIYNPNNKDVCDTCLLVGFDCKKALICNLLEENSEELKVKNRKIDINRVKTLSTITLKLIG